jgi:hypothetical protein
MAPGEPLIWACAWCRHIQQSSKKYELDYRVYSQRLDEAKTCECCGVKLIDPGNRGIGRFADVPINGKLRGIVCKRCHTVLGWIKEDQQSMALRMYNYIQLRNYQIGGTK